MDQIPNKKNILAKVTPKVVMQRRTIALKGSSANLD